MSNVTTIAPVPAGADVVLRRRLLRPTATLAYHVSGDFSTYTVQIWDDEGVSVYTTGAPVTVSNGDPVFNTLQAWDQDGTGFNFEYTVDQSDLAGNAFDGGRTYQAVIELDGGATYGTVRVAFKIPVESVGPV